MIQALEAAAYINGNGCTFYVRLLCVDGNEVIIDTIRSLSIHKGSYNGGSLTPESIY